MNIEYMKEYLELCRCLNFTAAAEKLFLTQSVLSRHIASLEAETGIKLLERTKRSVSVTEEGKLFYDTASQIVFLYEKMMNQLSSHQQGYRSVLRVGVIYYGIQEYVSSILRDFGEKYPNILLQITSGNPVDIINGVMNDRLDAGILERTEWSGSHRFDFIPLRHEPLVAAVSSSHPLAEKESARLAELSGSRLICIDNFYYEAYAEKTRALCKAHGFEITDYALTDSLETVFLMLQNRNTDGFHIMPMHLTKLAYPGLKFIRIQDEDCYSDICLFYKKEKKAPGLLQLLNLYREQGFCV